MSKQQLADEQAPRPIEAGTKRPFSPRTIFLAYTLLTLLLTWPTIARLTTHLAGGRDDLWVHQWTFWWIKQALLEGSNPFYTTYLYYPHGVALTSHNIAWFNIALWLPLQAIIGSNAAYNLIFMAVFLLNAWCMYLFAYAQFGNQPASFIAGIVYGFWPYTMSHYDHANMMVIFWVPLILLYLQRTLRQQQVRDGIITAVLLTLLGITRWQLILMSAPILLAFTGYTCLSEAASRTRRSLQLLLLIGSLSGLLMAPLAAPLLIDQATRDNPEDAFIDEREWGRTDLLAYVTPNLHNGLWHDKIAPYYQNFTVNTFYIPFLGYTTLLLAALAVARRWQQSRFWLLLAILYMLFALGPVLAINGHRFPNIPMPARLIEHTTPWQILRRPDRLNVFLSFPMAMLVGWAMVALAQSKRLVAKHKPWLIGLLASLILIEQASIPFASTPTNIPAWEQALADSPDPFATLDLPIYNRGSDKIYMFYQTHHGKPLATGHVSRMPREAFAFLDATPFLHLLRLNNLMDPAIQDISHQLQALANANIRYLVIHKQFAHEGLVLIWQDWLSMRPFYEDDDVVVYRTDPVFGEDFGWQTAVTDNLGLVNNSFAPTTIVQRGTLKVTVHWGSRHAPAADYRVCLRLSDSTDQQARQSCKPMLTAYPTSRWGDSELARGFYTMRIPETVPAGNYTLSLYLQDEAENPVGQTAVLGSITVQPYAPTHTSTLQWEDKIQLPGYQLHQSQDSLDLTFYWQSVQKMDATYKIFVHLIDPTSGDIVAQSDTIPRNWTYPTTIWDAGETVNDLISLPLTAVPPGHYQLWVGIYDQETGQRLPASDGHQTSDRYLLTEIDR